MSAKKQRADAESAARSEPDERIVAVNVVGPLVIEVEYADGTQATVRFEEDKLRGVQKVLADPDFFAGVHLSYGAVTWPDERYDLCPETMRLEIIAGGGEWVVTQPFKHNPEVTNAISCAETL